MRASSSTACRSPSASSLPPAARATASSIPRPSARFSRTWCKTAPANSMSRRIGSPGLADPAFGLCLPQRYPEETMAYVENRIVHDADSHLMELADCLDDFLDPEFRAGYDALPKLKAWPRDGKWVKKARATQDDPEFRAGDAANLMLRKNYEALGAFRREDRPKALDGLGFASQLVFTTWSLGNFGLDEGNDVALCYGVAEAHNRMMTHFCSVDRRLLATAYVPLADFERAVATARRAIDMGAKSLLIPSRCP